MLILTIPGELPNLNEYTKANRTSKYNGARMKQKAENKITHYIMQQLSGAITLDKAFLKFVWVEKNKKRDPDNVAFAKKFLLDALVTNGILKNDGWSCIEGFEDKFRVDKERPRIEIYIEEIKENEEHERYYCKND